MNLKSILVLLVIIVALAFFAFRKGGGREWEEMNSHTILPGDFPTEEIAEVEIDGQGNLVVLAKGEDGVWCVRDRGGYPADLEQLWKFVVALTQIRIAESFDLTADSRDEEYREYGLANPEGVWVTLRRKDRTPMATIVFGKKVELSGEELGGEAAATYGAEKIPVGRYLMLPAFAKPALVLFPFGVVDLPASAWLNKEFVRFPKVKRVEMVAGDVVDWRVSRAENQAQLALEGDVPAGKQVDVQKMGMMQGILGRLQFEDVQKSADDWSAECELRVEEFGGVKCTLRIGMAKEGMRPVALNFESGADAEDAGKARVAELNGKYAGWTYLVRERILEPFLGPRDSFFQERKDE